MTWFPRKTEQAKVTEPVMAMVRNRSRMLQQIGKIELMPGATTELDIANGTIGGALVADRTLEVIGSAYKGPLADAMGAKSVYQPQESTEASVGYMCPSCDFACLEAGEMLAHLASVHGDELLQRISDYKMHIG